MKYLSACLICASCLLLSLSVVSAQVPLPNAPAAWFVEDVKFQTGGSGRWLTDNGKYKNDQEPWDYYVMQWQAGPDHASMAGQMSALKDDVPSKGDFWHFSQYWDPSQKQATVQQNGWGVFGAGTVAPNGVENELEMTQTFTRFDGNSNLQGHRVKRVDDNSYETWSYLIDVTGKRTEGRYYLWTRQD